MDSKLKEAVEVLVNALKTDEGYRIGWQSNIAMAFHDTYYSKGKSKLNGQELHDVFNEASENFINQLCS
jgi:hypothetical protein